MIKRYLDDFETIKACYENNTRFQDYVYNLTYEHNMDLQLCEFEDIACDGLKCHNNYNSFFHTIENREGFFGSLLNQTYFNIFESDDEKTRTEHLLKLLNEYGYDSEKYGFLSDGEIDEIESELDHIANELLKRYDNHLHSYEHVSDEDIEYTLEMLTYDEGETYYIIDNDFSQIFEDIHETRRQF